MTTYLVIGSINTDLVSTVTRFAKPGETVISKSFTKTYGGKGANQCVALSKLGANTYMIGSVGNDTFGNEYLNEFKSLKVNIEGINIAECSTGLAIIEVEENSSNRIVLVPGANHRLNMKHILEKENIINKASTALLQLEIDSQVTLETLKILKKKNIRTILDPAPAKELTRDFFENSDFITPNETETEILTGIHPSDNKLVKKAANILIEKGATNIIIKSGKKGAFYINKNKSYFMPSYPVDVVDTTAAGDSFNAGFAFGLTEYNDIFYALKIACSVASLATTALGAQSAMPNLSEVEELIKKYSDIEVIDIS